MPELTPIGVVRCAQKYRYEAPRQAVLGHDNTAIIALNDDERLRLALTGLAGFARIWVIALFHHNPNWRPLVQPPREGVGRLGVFATRSPHRPNPIGLSCVELVKIDGLEVYIRNHDLLDGTPVLDLKPYVPYADAFPEAAAGWIDAQDEARFTVTLGPEAAERAEWIVEHAGLDVGHFARVQLSDAPTADGRKRIAPDVDGGLVIAYRTWRLHYRIAGDGVVVQTIRSGYSAADLAEAADPHADKAAHRAFHERYEQG